MNIQVTNLKDFWDAIDDQDGNKYSLVIEGEQEQCVLYAYDIENKKVLSALLLPKNLECPISIDVTWKNHIVHIIIQSSLKAQFNLQNLRGNSDFGEWINGE